MPTHVKYADRGNLLAYIDNVRDAARKDVKEKIGRAKIRYLRNSGGKSYNKQNLNILEATSRPLTLVVKKRRYDDLFEDFMEYLDEDKLYSPDTLKDELRQLFDKSKRFDDFRERRVKNYTAMIDNLTDKFLATRRAQEYFDEKTVERLTPARSTVYTKRIKKKQQDKWQKLVGQEKAYKIFNKQKKETQFIYEDKKARYRDINTGRFAPSPTTIRKTLMKEYK